MNFKTALILAFSPREKEPGALSAAERFLSLPLGEMDAKRRVRAFKFLERIPISAKTQ
jgi:hypothetical protein